MSSDILVPDTNTTLGLPVEHREWIRLITECVNGLVNGVIGAGATPGANLTEPDEDLSVFNVGLRVLDNGSDDVYTVSWSTGSGVSDTVHDLVITLFKNGSYVTRTTVLTPDTSSQEIVTVSGAGDFVQDHHHALLMLTTTSGVVYTQAVDVLADLPALLLENGCFFLLENGSKLVIES